MPQQIVTAVENNFTKGLITEATALNFPENAVTDCDNCDFTVLSDVIRRLGIDFEENYTSTSIARAGEAVSYYRWLNAGGDGSSKIFVLQVGSILRFYKYSDATAASPMSTTLMADTVNLSDFTPQGTIFDPSTEECEYSEGNGYLFVTNPAAEPIYISYIQDLPNPISASQINVQIRDFTGIVEANVADNVRPNVNTSFHLYNLQNQGWLNTLTWSTTSSDDEVIALGPITFTVDAGLPVVIGNPAIAYGNIYDFDGRIKYQTYVAGNVTAYAGTSMTITVTNYLTGLGSTATDWSITPYSASGQISTFKTAVGLYPSNSDVWWYFKNASGVFDPATTAANTTLGSGPAPKGFYILDAFNQRRDLLTGLSVPVYTTYRRPRTTAWHAGRVWYAGIDDTKLAAGYYYPYTWTENIYFSQVANAAAQFGRCYQTNDPTSEDLNQLLPTDGGTITIQGCGRINKLFSIQNGLLVFTANGVWFITGSQGIGFSASDYTVTKISSIKSISSSSFVDVNGLPYFWNEEGIYAVVPQQGGALGVDNVVVSTIQTFYDNIPLESKYYAKGSYNPVEYVIQWVYRDAEANNLTERYTYNRILNHNVFTKSFYPYTIAITPASIQGVAYITNSGGVDAPEAGFKYVASSLNGSMYDVTFADARIDTYEDWSSLEGMPYNSFLVTGYKLRGQAARRWQPQYINMYCKTDGVASGYKIQGVWDYANSGNSGRWSAIQRVINGNSRFDTIIRRHKIRGHGYALQFKISSSDDLPFNIQGWSTVDTVNQGT